MTQDKRLPAPGRVAKSDTRELLFQRLLLQVKTAQGGYFQMPALGLPREQRGMGLFDPTRLHNGWHPQTVVYIVNDVSRGGVNN